jgi:hypothetical protein
MNDVASSESEALVRARRMRVACADNVDGWK